jgi:4-phytase/acid phosphatase
MQQAVHGRPISGSIGGPADRALFLSGHDTNIENIAGALNLTWILDGRRNDTPPGGALVFEVWQQRSTQQYSVRLYYTAQTLGQMRTSAALSAAKPPERVAVFIPACSRADVSCALPEFLRALATK